MADDTSNESSGELELEARAHRLYWTSDQSVNSIADELGLSKGRLYDLVRPLHAGRSCGFCGSELVFENRTAQERDAPTCPACGEDPDEAPSDRLPARTFNSAAAELYHDLTGALSFDGMGLDSDDEGDSDDGSNGDDARPAPWTRSTAPLAPLRPETRGVVTGVLIGTMVGVLIGRLFRR